MNENVKLIKGKPYMVKLKTGDRVRRIFKYEETGILEIKRFVFTSRVPRGTYAEVEEKEDGTYFTWKNFKKKFPAQEISVPYYDLVSVTPAPL